MSAEKLRGGFYSPDLLVDLCLDRIALLTKGQTGLRLLEPSAGDGAFLRGLERNTSLASRTSRVDVIEPDEREAAKCAAEFDSHRHERRIYKTSAIGWSADNREEFDAAVGNPPFVRFQFVDEADRRAMPRLERMLGLSFAGVSNLWLPVLLGALGRLASGGAFAFIVPTECFTGISAGVLRKWLIQNTTNLRFDLFPPGSFPGVLQEVTILSGQRKAFADEASSCKICEHASDGRTTTRIHSIPAASQPWTRYLLTKSQISAFEEASALEETWMMSHVAKFEVAAVTGANDFFSVDASTLEAFELAPWSTPLLPRMRHAPGLRYTAEDHALVGAQGAKAHLLDFSADRPDPLESARASAYLQTGVLDELPNRYKCRIRSPWFRVPFIRPGNLMMSKRSHRFPRVVLNAAGVVTTDTIYRGSMLGFFDGRQPDLTAAFHNSLTLLSAEIEGRSFGGGVLELVPSEVGRLVVPMPHEFGAELDRLDEILRSTTAGEAGQALIDETDLLLVKAGVGITSRLVDLLREGRDSLLQRRLDRNVNSA